MISSNFNKRQALPNTHTYNKDALQEDLETFLSSVYIIWHNTFK